MHLLTSLQRALAAALLVGGTCATLPGAAAAASVPYPARNITFIVGYAPGGTGDVVARVLAPKLSESLGRSIIVENRAGASGSIAAQTVARAAPDGYTILVGQSAEIAINQHWMKGISYDPERDLDPIAFGANVPLGLVVPAKAPYSTVPGLIAAARASKQGLSYASAGTGTPGHFAGELLKLRAGINLLHVPYKGAGPALSDIIAGHVDLYFSGLPAAMGNIKAGQIKLLAVSSATRSAIAPDVPTVAEAAHAAPFDITLWVGFFAPHGTPAAIVTRLNSAINGVLAQPQVRDQLLADGAEISPMSIAQFAGFVKSESEKYARLVKDAGLKSE